jgi:transcriptional regulator, padR-like family
LNIQYKKGVIELCILSILSKKDMYGYELSEYISQKIDIADGTVYPILRKLKADGFVKTYLSEESGGPPRKYYSITQTGLNEFQEDSAEWLKFAETVNKIIKGDN